MNNKIGMAIAKSFAIIFALGMMSALVLDAHEEQKGVSGKNSRVFFQSSKLVNKSVIKNSTVGMKIDAKNSKVIPNRNINLNLVDRNQSKSTIEEDNSSK